MNFFQTISAVLAANALTLAWAFALWKVGRSDREGRDYSLRDLAVLIAAAKEHNVALEINSHWMRLDLRDTHVRQATRAGCLISINCDTHYPDDIDNIPYGILTARRGWLTPDLCINTWDAKKLHGWLKSKR